MTAHAEKAARAGKPAQAQTPPPHRGEEPGRAAGREWKSLGAGSEVNTISSRPPRHVSFCFMHRKAFTFAGLCAPGAASFMGIPEKRARFCI